MIRAFILSGILFFTQFVAFYFASFLDNCKLIEVMLIIEWMITSYFFAVFIF